MLHQTLPIYVFRQFNEQLAESVIMHLLHFEDHFGKEGVQRMNDFFSQFMEEDEDPPFNDESFPIKMYINSPGGVVTDLMSIIDTMENIEKPVETYCLGEAASCAAVLLSNGAKGRRFIGKNSHVLIHQVSAGMFGHIEDIKIALQQAEALNNQIISILSKNTGKPESKVRDDMDRDLWLNSQEALDYGLVDKILDQGANELKGLSTEKEKKIFNVGQDLEKKLKMADIEKKQFTVEIKNQEEDENYFVFEGYASVFNNTDDADDIVHPGAFTRTLKSNDLLDTSNERSILWQHDTKQPIGKAELIEDEYGLKFIGRLPKDDDFVRGRVIPQMKVGSLRTMSIGYRVADKYFKDGKRNITDMELYELSIVSFPCNEKAKITSYKKATKFGDLPLADDTRVWDSSAAIKRVREFTGSQDSPSETYKKAFLWYDEEKGDKFGSYKLPFVDAVDGKLLAVPRGLQAATNALKGSRGGVDIPSEDRRKVEQHINRYFEKMDKDKPFSNDNRKKHATIKEIKEVSSFLKKKGLSKNEREKVIYDLKKALSKPCNEELNRAPCNKGNGIRDVIECIKKETENIKQIARR